MNMAADDIVLDEDLIITEREQLDASVRRIDRVANMVSLAAEEISRHEREVSLAKARLTLKDEVIEFLEVTQSKLHEQTVGRYERLLTAIMRDVFPDGEDTVSIDVSTKRGLISIDFVLKKPSGETESIMNGRGGSVANVMSIGLRFIALSQTELRPFMVLDESDCWMKPDRVPMLSRVIHMLSQQIGIQTLVISHNDPAHFSDHALMVSLKREGDSVIAEPSFEPEWDTDQKGIRGIYLQDMMSHHKTHIPLSSGVTVLVGDNDIGKSAIVTGLRAFYGEGNDSMIRHGADKASVAIDLGFEGTLIWERSRKGAKRTRYALMSPQGEMLHETQDAAVPAWLEGLGFRMEDELDIQIGHQKRPIFLLDVPDTKRAAILSIGKESSWVAHMRSQYNSDLRDDSQRVKEGEKRIQQLTPRVAVADRVELAQDNMEQLKDQFNGVSRQFIKIQGQRRNIDRLKSLAPIAHKMPVEEVTEADIKDVDELKRLTGKIHLLSPLQKQVEVPEVTAPELNIDALNQQKALASRIEKGTPLLSLNQVNEVVVPEFDRTVGELRKFTKQLKVRLPLVSLHPLDEVMPIEVVSVAPHIAYLDKLKASMKLVTLKPVDAVEAIDEHLADTDKLTQLVTSYHARSKEITDLEAEIKDLTLQMENQQKVIDDLIEQNGGICPTCERTMEKGVHSHD